MRHHLRRAKHVYETRGFAELARTALGYGPIEVNNFLFRLRYGSGTRVMDEDWDTLVILDACRYDMFADRVPFDGTLESRISLGSTSEEFLERNFADGRFHDTVYVNANAYLPRLGLDQDGTFHSVVDLLDEWDPDLEIAHPETVADAAQEAHAAYPDKRLIVHFMQPHIPFIGTDGRELQEKIEYRSVWKPLRNGTAPVDEAEVWNAYFENLDVVFGYVEGLLEDLDGKTVITADHGNLVGERQGPVPTRRMYGHPWGVYAPELVKVPWFVVESNGRRDIEADPPERVEAKSDDVVEDRLRALGYTD